MKIKELRPLCFDEKNDDFFRKKNRENEAVSRQIAFNNFDLTRKNYEFFCGNKTEKTSSLKARAKY